MKPYPRWLTWLVVLFIGYILVVGNFAPRTEPTAPTETAASAEEKTYPVLAQLTDGERWKKAINPEYQSPDDACRAPSVAKEELPSYAIRVTEGMGDGAACGSRVGVVLTRWGNDGKANKPVELELMLGEQPALDSLLRGMQLGEERLLVVRLPQRVRHLPFPPKTQLLLQVVRVE